MFRGHTISSVFNPHAAGIFGEDWCTGKAEQLRLGEKCLDGLMIFTELGTVTLVEDEHHALIA